MNYELKVQIFNDDVNCLIKLSRRKSISISVSIDGDVKVLAPIGTTQKKILSLIDDNKIWISNKIEKLIISKKDSNDYSNNGFVYYLGEGLYYLC